MSERVSDEYLTRIIEQKAGVMPMHLALDLRDARTSLDVLRRNGINAFCLSVDEAKDPHRACAALRAERDAALAESERMRPVVEVAEHISHYPEPSTEYPIGIGLAHQLKMLCAAVATFRASAQKEEK